MLRDADALPHVDEPELASIDGYRRLGGYEALEKALQRASSPTTCSASSRTRACAGRGGAGFSMGKKASFLPRGDMDKYLCCNADESEPGAFKDRELMQKNPHQLIEGIAIAALAADADRCFIFIRGEYDLQGDILDKAVAEAYEAGFLGENVLGTGAQVELVVHRGAGAYICGEETALLDCARGQARQPAAEAAVPGGPGPLRRADADQQRRDALQRPPHRREGADWFKSFGTEQSPGTKVVSVSGYVQRPGNYEVELGIPTREIIYGLAGGPPEGRKIKAWYPGRLLGAGADRRRSSTSPTASRRWPRPGSMLGSGSIIVADETTSIVELALRTARFYHHESCGKCTPCREGTNWTVKMLERVVRGEATPIDLDVDRLGPGEHHRQLPLRARRLDGDAGRLDGREVPQRVRGRDRSNARPRRAAIGALARGRSGWLHGRPMPADPQRGDPGRRRPRGGRARGRRCSSTPPSTATSRSRSSVTSRSWASRSAPAACAWSRSRACPKLQTACSTPVRDGMVVYTQTDQVKEAQNAVVEFLLVNHPLDCPVCDKGGECPLQDISMGWGPGKSRFTDPKRHFQKPLELSPLVAIDRERCILCYRCVRFSQEVAEDEQLQLLERGDRSYVGTFDDRPYVAPFHGNIIELCPVGALTTYTYRFRARPWDIEDAGSVCTLCPSQCNVKFTVRDERRGAGAGPRQPRGRRRLALRQGPLRLPDVRLRGPDHRADGPRRATARCSPISWDEALDEGRERPARPPGPRAAALARRRHLQRGGLADPAHPPRGARLPARRLVPGPVDAGAAGASWRGPS